MAPGILPTPEKELELHRRLVERDPVAPADLAIAFLNPLIDWLAEHNSHRLDQDYCFDAAVDAFQALAKNPNSFRPDLPKSLFAYLCMSAQGDLRNRLQKEKRRLTRQVSLETFEVSPDDGNYLGREDDPSLRMENSELMDRLNETILAFVRQGLTEEELEVLDLMLEGERKTAVFAQVLRLDHMAKDLQEAEVKKVKDKLKSRIKRGRDTHEQSS